MIVLGQTREGVDVRLSRDELVMINNALNEICNGVRIDHAEFQTRLGRDRETMSALLSEVNRLLRSSN